jgi:hypothetical protein
MPGPQPPPVKLTERQRKMLAHLVRRSTATQGLVRRAGIVLAAAEGANNQQRSPTDSVSTGRRCACGAGGGWRHGSALAQRRRRPMRKSYVDASRMCSTTHHAVGAHRLSPRSRDLLYSGAGLRGSPGLRTSADALDAPRARR